MICQRIKQLSYVWGLKKRNFTWWDCKSMRSILRSPKLLGTYFMQFLRVFRLIMCGLKIDLIDLELHCVKIPFLETLMFDNSHFTTALHKGIWLHCWSRTVKRSVLNKINVTAMELSSITWIMVPSLRAIMEISILHLLLFHIYQILCMHGTLHKRHQHPSIRIILLLS